MTGDGEQRKQRTKMCYIFRRQIQKVKSSSKIKLSNAKELLKKLDDFFFTEKFSFLTIYEQKGIITQKSFLTLLSFEMKL